MTMTTQAPFNDRERRQLDEGWPVERCPECGSSRVVTALAAGDRECMGCDLTGPAPMFRVYDRAEQVGNRR